jgi:hypothetical protein
MPRRGPANIYDSMPLIPGQPEPAPPELTAEEAREWDKIVARLPPDWVGAGFPLLIEACRHIVYARELAAMMAPLWGSDDPSKRELLLSLLRQHAVQSQAIGNLLTKTRATAQSRYQPSTANSRARDGVAADARKPWDGVDGVGDRRQ